MHDLLLVSSIEMQVSRISLYLILVHKEFPNHLPENKPKRRRGEDIKENPVSIPSGMKTTLIKISGTTPKKRV